MKKIFLVSGLLLSVFVSTSSLKKQEKRPNIIVILADDLGYNDVSFNGSTDIKTPNLDQLAYSGTIMSSAYVAHPFCGPSRAALMSGRYPHAFGSQFNLPANSEEKYTGIPQSEVFIGNVLQKSGYHTGAIGKWHLGAVPGYHPNERGFDEFYGFLGGGHKYFPEEYKATYKKQKAAGTKVIFDYLHPLEYNGKEVTDEQGYLTDILSNEANKFVNKASQKKDPFFLYLAYNAPHAPMEATKEDLAQFSDIKDPKRRTYAAMVYGVDRGVGKLIEELKRTNQFENTLIVFLSDNGGDTSHGASNLPLTGRKGDTNEGGFRVPMFFHWPNNIKSNTVYEYPVSAMDFYPTFAALAGAEIPKGKVLDGKDICKALKNHQNARSGEPIFALRHRSGFSDVGVRKDNWKALKTGTNAWELYDIKNDIAEKNDLSSTHPELLKDMVTKAQKWSKTHTEPLWFDPEELSEVWKEKEMAKFKETFDIKKQ